MNIGIFSWILLCHHLQLLNKGNKATTGYSRLRGGTRKVLHRKYSMADITFSMVSEHLESRAEKGNIPTRQGCYLHCQSWLCSPQYQLPNLGQWFPYTHTEKLIWDREQTWMSSSDTHMTGTRNGRCSNTSCCFSYPSPTWLVKCKPLWTFCHCWNLEASSFPSNTAGKE